MNKRAQQGQFIISFVIALVLFTMALGVWWAIQRTNYVQQKANVQGAAIAQWGVGIRTYIANVEGGSATLPSNPYIAPAGVNWLKPPTCGGLGTNPAQGYVPCSFDGGPLGSQFQTTITQTPGPPDPSTGQPTQNIRAVTSFKAGPETGNDLKSSADMAAKIAFASLAQQDMPINGTFINVYSNAPTTATAQPNPAAMAPADVGRVVMVAENAPSQDLWLRVDGTNHMLANLDVGGHDLVDTRNGSFSGDVRVKGVEQIDGGLHVTNGPLQADHGITTSDQFITARSRYASQAIYDAAVYTGQPSYSIPKPDCSQADGAADGGLGGSQPKIFTMLQNIGNTQTGAGYDDSMYSSWVQVTDAGASWTVTPHVNASRMWLSTAPAGGGATTITLNKAIDTGVPNNAAVVVMTKCD